MEIKRRKYTTPEARRELSRERKERALPDRIRDLEKLAYQLRASGLTKRADAVDAQVREMKGKV